MKFFKKQKPPLGMPAIEIFFKSRRCQRRPLPPASKHTSLVIFFKVDLEFEFLFFNGLLPYKTQSKDPHIVSNHPYKEIEVKYFKGFGIQSILEKVI